MLHLDRICRLPPSSENKHHIATTNRWDLGSVLPDDTAMISRVALFLGLSNATFAHLKWSSVDLAQDGD